MFVSWAGRGEDIVLNRLFGNRKSGIYIDIGCARPKDGSLTYRLYRQGWRGIVVDARSDLQYEWQRKRPLDIQIFSPLTKNGGVFKIENNGYRTKLFKKSIFHREEVKSLSVAEFANIYRNNFSRLPDIIKIDIEGFEYNVLIGLLNQKIYGKLFIIEVIDQKGSEFVIRSEAGKIVQLMKKNGYSLQLNDGVNLWFTSRHFKFRKSNYWAPPYPGSQEKFVPAHLTINSQLKSYAIRIIRNNFMLRYFR